MDAFEFATATRIIFGPNTVDQVAGLAAGFGKSVLLITGGKSTAAAANRLEQQLHDRQITVTRFRVSGEPDVETIDAGLKAAADADCDHVIALGGGSVIDTGKVIVGLLTNGGSVLDYVEVIGRGQPIKQPAAPLIAIPTTAGTGAEVTRNGVIAVKDKQVKVSMRSPYLLPRVAVVDPVLTYTLPPDVTASTGLDALTQLIEPYTSSRRNPLTDTIAEAGIQRVSASFVIAYLDGNPAARDDMAFASLCGGLALANSGLGAVHGFAGVIGGRYPIPHGVCCAILLPHVIKANIAALQAREPDSPVLRRYVNIAALMTGKVTSESLADHISELSSFMEIPTLSAFGVTRDALPDLVAQSQQASSMKANPIKLTADELTSTLTAAL